MSVYASTQILKPNDWQAFERANRVLFRHVLNDPSVKPYGIGGQGQDGVDLTGCRNSNPLVIVGVQAKKKEDGASLSVKEAEEEYKKALNFQPRLSEYIITTTAKDSTDLDTLALKLSQQIPAGWDGPLKVQIWGWETMQSHILEYPEATKAFDPSHTPHGDQILQSQEDMARDVSDIKVHLAALTVSNTSDASAFLAIDNEVKNSENYSSSQTAIVAEIDRYSELSKQQPDTALDLLQKLEKSLSDVDGHLRYKLSASQGLCELRLGNNEQASKLLLSAFLHDPSNPKAIANKALGFLAADRNDELVKFAEAEILKAPDNAWLIAYRLKGLSRMAEGGDYSFHLTPDIQKDAEVKHGMICWQMEHGEDCSWHEIAHDAADAFPEMNMFKELSASANLESVIGETGMIYGYQATDEEVRTVELAVTKLQACWKDVLDKKDTWRSTGLSVPFNLITALRFLNRLPEAKTVVEAALDFYPDSLEMKERAGVTFYELDEYNRSRALFDEVGIKPNNVMAWMNLYLNSEDWDGLINLFETHFDSIPKVEQKSVEAAYHLAHFEKTPYPEKAESLKSLRSEFAPDIRGALILSQGAKLNNFEDEAEYYYRLANDLVDQSAFSQAERVTLAREAYSREEYSLTANLLDGHLDLRIDTQELFILANAVAHERPFRQRGLAFFESLPTNIKDQETYAIIEGQFHVNRGEPTLAKPLFVKAYRKRRHLNTLLGLLACLTSLKDHRAVQRLLDDETIDQLPGAATSGMHLAQILMRNDYSERAHTLGYQNMVRSQQDSKTTLGYCGLFFLLKNKTVQSNFTPTVGEGNWVLLRNENGDEITGIIEEDDDRVWGKSLKLTNPIIQACYGKATNETFDAQSPMAGTEQWTVIEVKPRWLQAFHFLSNTFSTRFPGVSGIMTYKTSDDEDSLEPTFRQIRRHSEQSRATADLYLLQNFPMAIVTHSGAGGAIGFADYLNRIGEPVRTCIGTTQERNAAYEVISKHKKKGAVIDAFTAWRSAELNIFEALIAVLGPISIPQTEIDMLERLIEPLETEELSESMSLSYEGGQYYRDIQSVEDQRQTAIFRRGLINSIKEHCEVENAPLPNYIPEIGETLLTIPSGEAIVPLIYAGKERLVLTDDMHLRDIGTVSFETVGVWLQVVLQVAQSEGHITEDEYGNALVILASRRHSHLALNNAVLKNVFDNDDASLARFKCLIYFIGGTNADRRSHVSATNEFLADVELSEGRTPKAIGAANALFSSMVLRGNTQEAHEWMALLMVGLNQNFRLMLIEWASGHFLDVQAAIDLLNEAVNATK